MTNNTDLMTTGSATALETSLDPQDWELVRHLGHRMIDDMVAHLRDVRMRPVWTEVPGEVRQRFMRDVPFEPDGPEAVYDEFLSSVLPYGLGNIHPRFWGWVIGTGTFTGALAELLAASMNTNTAGFNTSLVLLEEQVIEWFRQLFRMPEGASGLLVTGGSQANFVGLAAGVRAKLGAEYRQRGIFGLEKRPMVYASNQTHFSVRRAIRLLGLGEESIRTIPATDTFAIDVDALRSAIRDDRNNGLQPTILIANAGTVGVGAFDPFDELADIAAAENMWLHTDGAFGSMAALTSSFADRVAGMERADSLTFDLHKWLHVPIESAGVLIRDASAHGAAFGIDGAYINDMKAGPATGVSRFTNLGIEQSRAGRALKVWFSLREHGLRKIGASVEMNMHQARWLADEVTVASDMELLAPVACNIVCFRYVPVTSEALDLNTLNQEILLRIQTRGIALPSAFSVNGKFAIRCSITNHRTTYADLDVLLTAVRNIGCELLRESPPAERTTHVS